jgi:hypothetical protein
MFMANKSGANAVEQIRDIEKIQEIKDFLLHHFILFLDIIQGLG